MLPAPRPASRAEVPVLDLGGLIEGGPIDELGRELRHACETIGFFYVSNHGVAQSVVDNAFEATRRYFALPLEQRMRDKIDERFRRGFMPTGINQHPGYAPDLKESFEYCLDLPLDDPDVVAGRPLHGPNRWPLDKPWLRAAAEPYFDATMALGKRLLRVVAASLGQHGATIDGCPADTCDRQRRDRLKAHMLALCRGHRPAQDVGLADERSDKRMRRPLVTKGSVKCTSPTGPLGR